MPCPSHCLTCTYDNSSSSVLCLSCPTDLYLNSSQCLPCPNGTYYLSAILNCANCSTYCKTCDIVSCITCESDLFSVSHLTGKCEDLCGDGFVVTLPCDGGKGIANDGCAEDCTIEPNYSCILTGTANPFPNSTVSVSLSKCSYLSQPVLSLHRATQSLYENRMSLVFKVNPYLHGLPIGN
jgi:cysteine-rich repeat protein